jgi:alpha,alpha-trehalase
VSSKPIGDYGLLPDCNSGALVDRTGSIDWLCMPRYDSAAIFARMLDPAAGHWSLRPTGSYEVERRYLDGTLVVETTFTTGHGVVRLTDAMAFAEGQRVHDLGLGAPHEVLRLVEGVSGEVEMEMELAPRPEYGLVRPLCRGTETGGRTFGGPNQIVVNAGVPIELDEATMRAAFSVENGDAVGFALRWAAVEHPQPAASPPTTSLRGSPTSSKGGAPGRTTTTSTTVPTATRSGSAHGC